MLRLLALHSFRTSGAIFKWQVERTNLDKSIGDLAEIVYIDAPNLASGPIPRDVKPFFGDGPFYEWTTVQEMGDQFEFDVEKLERSMSLVEQKLRDEGPFDGLIGFSQGTLLASVIVMLQQRGLILQTVPPLKFCILFAGLKSRYPPHAEVFKMGKVPVPSLHIYGDRDQIREHCVDLADAFQDPVIIQHPRGHSIPNLVPHQLAVIRAFLSSFSPRIGGGTAALPGNDGEGRLISNVSERTLSQRLSAQGATRPIAASAAPSLQSSPLQKLHSSPSKPGSRGRMQAGRLPGSSKPVVSKL